MSFFCTERWKTIVVFTPKWVKYFNRFWCTYDILCKKPAINNGARLGVHESSYLLLCAPSRKWKPNCRMSCAGPGPVGWAGTCPTLRRAARICAAAREISRGKRPSRNCLGWPARSRRGSGRRWPDTPPWETQDWGECNYGLSSLPNSQLTEDRAHSRNLFIYV